MRNYTSRSHHEANYSTKESLSNSPEMETFEICQEQTTTLLVPYEALSFISDPKSYFGQFGHVEQIQSSAQFMQVRFSDV